MTKRFFHVFPYLFLTICFWVGCNLSNPTEKEWTPNELDAGDTQDAGDDKCPEDPDKTEPGICGCGVSDEADGDHDGVVDCIDQCPDNPNKSEQGICGCKAEDETCKFSKLVYPDANGKLVYAPDEQGNIIPDFSYVGYKNGEEAIPEVPVITSISPIAGDNRDHIQNAINKIAEMPLTNGIRGALLLKRGEYRVGGQIDINQSGIVIRGEGTGEADTRVIATKREQHDLFRFSGAGGASEVSSSKVQIVGSYIPVGERTFTVQDHSFQVGDTVLVTRAPKQSWISMLGMDKLENASDPDDFNWTTDEYTMKYKRVIKEISGNKITVDAPLVDPIDEQYATGYVSKYNWEKKITNVGIENIRLISEYAGEDDESHGWNAIVINHVQDGWVRNIESHYFGYSAVNILRGAYRISVLDSKQMYPKSKTTGGRKYSFAVNGELVLVKDCFAHSGRHDFVGHARTPGPNVFVNCSSQNQLSDIGPHHRWSTGMLFDNIVGTRDMAVQNRMYSGSGHGWSGAQILFWNSTMNKIIIQSPPNHINWAIGNIASTITSKGAYVDVPGYTESNNENVWPESLYEQQLKDRLGQ